MKIHYSIETKKTIINEILHYCFTSQRNKAHKVTSLKVDKIITKQNQNNRHGAINAPIFIIYLWTFHLHSFPCSRLKQCTSSPHPTHHLVSTEWFGPCFLRRESSRFHWESCDEIKRKVSHIMHRCTPTLV